MFGKSGGGGGEPSKIITTLMHKQLQAAFANATPSELLGSNCPSYIMCYIRQIKSNMLHYRMGLTALLI